jgi:hypothetical protein
MGRMSPASRILRAFRRMVDTSRSFQHPSGTVLIFRRLPTVLLTFALSASPVALCAGWMATPEARMACCSEAGACPMHKSDAPDHSPRAVTQAEADRCCAASGQDGPAPSSSASTLAAPAGVVLGPVPLVLPSAAAQPHVLRKLVPVTRTHVPKHLLLSVFLV